MSRTAVLASLALAGAACVGMVAAQSQDAAPVPAKAAAAPSKPLPPIRALKSMAQGDLKWETNPESKISIAVVSGDHKTGAYEAFLKFPAGLAVPLHWHTFSNTGVGVSGTLVVDAQGQGTIEMGPGTWGFVPGRVKHTTTCKEGTDCVIYVRQPGKDDIYFVNAGPVKKAPPKK
jgi:hypothetical protein